MSAVVSLQGVCKEFPARKAPPVIALQEMSLEIGGGEVVGLLGPNGAGKSTSFWILMGMLEPTAGRVEVLGRRAGDPALLHRIGLQPERFTFHHFQTPKQLFGLHARLLAPNRHEELLRAGYRAVDRFGIAHAWERKIRQFSQGMLQRVALAQALAHSPDVLLLDEPSANLDPAGRKLVRDVIVEEKERGTTVVISSHILSEIEAVCDRVAVLAQGRLKGVFEIDELLGQRDRWMVEVSSLGPDDVEALRREGVEVTLEEEVVRIRPSGDVWDLLEWLRHRDVDLISVKRGQLTLEEAYLKILEDRL